MFLFVLVSDIFTRFAQERLILWEGFTYVGCCLFSRVLGWKGCGGGWAGKTIALTRRNFVGKVMSLLLNRLSRLVITFLPRSKRIHVVYFWAFYSVTLISVFVFMSILCYLVAVITLFLHVGT